MVTTPLIPIQVGDIVIEVEAVTVPGTQPTASPAKAAEKVREAFDRAQETIVQIAQSTAQMIDRAGAAARPDRVDVVFGLKFSVSGGVIMAGVAGEASLKVTLGYDVAANLRMAFHRWRRPMGRPWPEVLLQTRRARCRHLMKHRDDDLSGRWPGPGPPGTQPDVSAPGARASDPLKGYLPLCRNPGTFPAWRERRQMSSNGVFTSNGPLPAVSATGTTDNADGIDASSISGFGVLATSQSGSGVLASSNSGPGLVANTEGSGQAGIVTSSITGIGLYAIGGGVPGDPPPPVAQGAIVALGGSGNGVFVTTDNGAAVSASDQGSGTGVQAGSDSGTAVQANSTSGTAVFAQSGTGNVAHPPPGIGVHAVGGGSSATTRISQAGIFAEGGSGNGVVALTTNGTAVTAVEDGGGTGVSALSNGGVAVLATDNGGGVGVNATRGSGTGVRALSGSVEATSHSNVGVFAQSQSGIGVHAVGGGATAATLTPITEGAILAEGGPATGVYATSNSGTGVEASSQSGPGVSGASVSGSGVQGRSDTSTGVSGVTESGFGVTANGGSAGVALQVIGKVEVQGHSVGSVAMAAGTKTLKVNNSAATANSLIFLTPLEDPQAFLWIGARNPGSFTIDTSKALPAAVTIVFLIIN